MNNQRPSPPTLETQMLSTLELLHYCRRFQDTLFAFCFEHSEHCVAVLTDLRILQAARIRQVIFCAADKELARTLKRWNRAGERFVFIEATPGELTSTAFIERISTALLAGKAPLVALKEFPRDEATALLIEAQIVECTVTLGAKKVFFPNTEEGLIINGRFRSYPRAPELKAAIKTNAAFNISLARLTALMEHQERHKIDIVLVQARPGSVYEEVFTHSGSGTLLTRDYPNVLRPAAESDVRDIMAIMQPYISEGTLKPVSEDELLTLMRSFTVYSVNDQIIAAAALIDYGDSCELGKLCTLPRYQGRGRARALVRALLEQARAAGKRSVFALTVQPPVAEFFAKLGFKSIHRETLPPAWRVHYDLSRPSQACEFVL